MVPIPEREFNLYALALPGGPNFEPYVVVSGWKCDNARSVGGVLLDHDTGDFAIRAFRRRIDHCFVLTSDKSALPSHDAALTELTAAMRSGDPPESIAPGVKKRPPLLDIGNRMPGKNFKLLMQTANHVPAAIAVGEIYLAMPNPDDNFVSDFQTTNFDSRLFELYLLATFREQGVTVLQDHESPDFFIQRAGHECFVEAVTANPKEEKIQGLTLPTFAPESREERLPRCSIRENPEKQDSTGLRKASARARKTVRACDCGFSRSKLDGLEPRSSALVSLRCPRKGRNRPRRPSRSWISRR